MQKSARWAQSINNVALESSSSEGARTILHESQLSSPVQRGEQCDIPRGQLPSPARFLFFSPRGLI